MAESRFKIILTDLSNNKDKYKLLHLGSKKKKSIVYTVDGGDLAWQMS